MIVYLKKLILPVVLSCLAVALLAVLLVSLGVYNFDYENDIAEELARFNTLTDILNLSPGNVENEYIVNLYHQLSLMKYSEDEITIDKEVVPSFDNNSICFTHRFSDGSFYITNKNNGLLLSPNLEQIRKDEFPDLIIRKSWISDSKKTAVFTPAVRMEMAGYTVVDLDSKKVLHDFSGETSVGLLSFQDKMYFFSVFHDENWNPVNLRVRDTSEWNVIKEIPLEGYIYQDCFIAFKSDDKQKLVLGSTLGQLIILDLLSFGIEKTITLSSSMILSMCKIDDRRIVVGNEDGKLYLVNLETLNIRTFPVIKDKFGSVSALAYQPSSQTLAVGRGCVVWLWKLKEAAFKEDVSN